MEMALCRIIPSAVTGQRKLPATARTWLREAGVDVVSHAPSHRRLINIPYTPSWMGGVDNIHPDNTFALPPTRCCASGRGGCSGRLRAWNQTYAKTHFVTAVVICFSGNAKTTRGDSL